MGRCLVGANDDSDDPDDPDDDRGCKSEQVLRVSGDICNGSADDHGNGGFDGRFSGEVNFSSIGCVALDKGHDLDNKLL